MNDDTTILIMFICFLCIIGGTMIGGFAASFTTPSMKIWNSNRTYDKILLADNVICKPANEMNATYWRTDTVKFNGTEYIAQQVRVGNTTAKGVIVCTD